MLEDGAASGEDLVGAVIVIDDGRQNGGLITSVIGRGAVIEPAKKGGRGWGGGGEGAGEPGDGYVVEHVDEVCFLGLFELFVGGVKEVVAAAAASGASAAAKGGSAGEGSASEAGGVIGRTGGGGGGGEGDILMIVRGLRKQKSDTVTSAWRVFDR